MQVRDIQIKNELYIHKQRQGVAAGTDVPFTASWLSNHTASSNQSGWTYLPSGILIKWEGVSGTGLVTKTLDITFPAFSYIFAAFVSPTYASGVDEDFSVSFVNVVSAAQVRVYFSKRSTTGAAAGVGNVMLIGV